LLIKPDILTCYEHPKVVGRAAERGVSALPPASPAWIRTTNLTEF
jgi:hypothetical protein